MKLKNGLWVLFFCSVAVGVGVGCVRADDVPAASPGDAELAVGRDVYSANCARCHGADGSGGQGDRLNNGRLAQMFPDPADQKVVIVQGRAGMPAFEAKLSDAEIDAVVRFTRENLP